MCTDFLVYRHRVTAPRPSLPFLQKLILVVQSALSAPPPGFWPKSAAILFAVHRPLFIFTLYIPIHYFICRSSLSFIHSSVSAARGVCVHGLHGSTFMLMAPLYCTIMVLSSRFHHLLSHSLALCISLHTIIIMIIWSHMRACGESGLCVCIGVDLSRIQSLNYGTRRIHNQIYRCLFWSGVYVCVCECYCRRIKWGELMPVCVCVCLRIPRSHLPRTPIKREPRERN